MWHPFGSTAYVVHVTTLFVDTLCPCVTHVYWPLKASICHQFVLTVYGVPMPLILVDTLARPRATHSVDALWRPCVTLLVDAVWPP